MSSLGPTYARLIKDIKELVNNRENLEESEYRVKASSLLHKAKKYGVHLEVKKILESEPKSHAVIKSAGGGKNYGQIPLRNKEEVVKAAEWLKNYRDRLTYNERKTAATRILGKSAEFGVIHEPDIEKMLFRIAGVGIGDIDVIKKQITKRADYFNRTSRTDIANQLKKLIEILDSTNIETFYKEGAYKLASELDTVDKMSGIATRYGKGYMIPEDFLFSTTAVEVEETKNSLVGNIKTGKYYHKEDFPSANVSVFEGILGGENLDQVSFLGFIDPSLCREWLKTASKEEAELFDIAMSYSGIRPYAEKLPEEE